MRITIRNELVTMPLALWHILNNLLAANLAAWENEEDSVREEHADLISDLIDLDEVISDALMRGHNGS